MLLGKKGLLSQPFLFYGVGGGVPASLLIG
jgi:hypothetical protein